MYKPYVKLFGERNTGTRAMKEMLRQSGVVDLNLPNSQRFAQKADRIDLASSITAHFDDVWRKHFLDALRDRDDYQQTPLAAWKHTCPEWHSDFAKHKVHVLMMVRNPYSWAVSMARRPYHIAGPRTPDFLTFLTRPWMTQRRDNTDPLLASVIELWNVKTRACVAFRDAAREAGVGVAIVRFEDFVTFPEASLRDVLVKWGVRGDHIRAQSKSTKSDGQDLASLQSYYAQEIWQQYHTEKSIDLITQAVDWDTADEFNYEGLISENFPAKLPEAIQQQFSREMMSMVAARERLNRKAGAASAA